MLAVAGPAAAGAPKQAAAGSVVKTADGALRGISRTRYEAWLGIPYAAPPVGDRRFKAPERAARWSSVRDATRFGDRCVQGTGWDPGYEENTLTSDQRPSGQRAGAQHVPEQRLRRHPDHGRELTGSLACVHSAHTLFDMRSKRR